jgi:prepilin peptidase CpaA
MAAAVTDVRTRKIPNAIPIAVAVFGLALNAFGGWRDLGSAAAAGAIVLLVGTIPFGLGLIGGGDVKLLAACASVFGLSYVLAFLVYTALIGGVFALCFAAATGQFRSILTGATRKVVPALLPGTVAAAPSRTRLPYAVAIAGGTIWLLLGDTLLPALKILR